MQFGSVAPGRACKSCRTKGIYFYTMNYVVMHTSINQEPVTSIEKPGLYILISHFCYELLGFIRSLFSQLGRQFSDFAVVRLVAKEIVC